MQPVLDGATALGHSRFIQTCEEDKMTEVKLDAGLPASVAEVWKLIGGFHAVPDWHPAVESSETEDGGKVRRLKLLSGGEIVEKLEANDDHSYTYSIIESPLPVKNYTSTIRVVEGEDGKARVEWSSSFDAVGQADMAAAAIQGIYDAGLANLKKMFGG